MKKLLLCAAIFLAGLVMISCDSKGYVREPVSFYYPRTEYQLGTEDGVFSHEVRDRDQFDSSTDMLNVYLQGPENSTLTNPFPNGMTVIRYEFSEEGQAVLVLSDEYSNLTGLHQTLATVSLCKTCMQMDSLSVIAIYAGTDESPALIMDAETIAAYDHDLVPSP